ncbi:hypothetical protein PHYSODRAFT_297766 [Phytophthora sojae]|uniref:Uncharacterized protein n=1 Tax=Phytophthora sojae (strain P6497) TaxID=1094619 RepID=G4Z8R6_PHYSP|nr:hypothetical protein PHYSODRAFT_297766 [Phytophthora sojae]EGZ19098.1 hypothetical protein PHYSODRAFT_297766 [Phytophthora sojae]|eukprot:XP_009521815.1 hypothetical protein PHYSODRAFT_297766 [Phytophthora sojae]
MVSGKLVAVLEDVELQLQKVTLAVKLHLKMLRKGPQSPPVQSRESRDQLVALSKSIEAMQSELRTVTSEILALATKSLAVDASEAASAGEETETEDEMDEDEKASVPVDGEATLPLEGGPIPVKVKSEPLQQNPTTASTQQRECIVNVPTQLKLGEQLLEKAVVATPTVKRDSGWASTVAALRKRLIKNYGYASYQKGDSNLDSIEERVEGYKRDTRQLKPKAIARPICSITTRLVNDLEILDSKGLVRTEKNWERFAALGNVVAEWMAAGQGSKKVRMQAKYFRGLSQQLVKLDKQYPGRLPPALLRCAVISVQ